MDLFPTLLDFVKQGGTPAAVIFAILYWLERQERKETQERHERTVRESIELWTKTEAALSAMSTMLGARK